MEIAKHTFLITGGASGLGEAVAQTLASAGANILIADLNEEAGKIAAENLGDHALFTSVDVTQEESIRHALEKGKEAFGAIHGAINCAGIVHGASVVGKKGPYDFAAFCKVIDINLNGTFNVIRLTAEHMLANEPDEEGERGILINTASIAAFDGQIGQAAYAASKGGVVSMTLPIARELARHGIRVMTIAPGVFDTPMMANVPEEIRQSLAQQIPFPSRFGKPHEFGALAKHIIENPMLNGEVIRLDGATRMPPK